MLLPNRHGSIDTYRYGFNGKEKDDEVKGQGVQYDYGFRIYDTRLGKFLSIDPLTANYPWYTPYQFAGNTPIQAIDLDGLEEIHYSLTIKSSGEVELQYSHSVDIIDKVLVIDRAATQWLDPGEYHYENRINIRKQVIIDIYNPSYGMNRESRTDSYAEKVNKTHNSFRGSKTMSQAGAGYAEAYDLDAYDYGAAFAGVDELSNAAKDAIDTEFLLTLLLELPIARIAPKVRFKIDDIDGEAIIKTIDKEETIGRGWLGGYSNDGFEANFSINSKGSGVAGGDVFDSLLSMLSKWDDISSIRGTWRAGNMGDNLATFNKLVNEGKSLNDAALETFTGKMAKKNGFSNARVDLSTLRKNDNGEYISVDVFFTK
jgi:RHS repeat-associated protein